MLRRTILDECGSTNAEAKDTERFSHGDAVIAIRQTAGRGQRGRSWESTPGENLTFSVVLEPVFLPAARQFMLSEVVALAVAGTLGEYGIEARIKWTNDIYVGDRKICGILIEHDLGGGNLARTVAGIGLNVNQTEFPEWLPNPTSMAVETGCRFDITEVFDVFSSKLEPLYAALERGEEDTVRSAYHGRLYRLGRPHRYFIPGRGEIEGIIRGVEPTGELIVETDGKEEKFLFKEIEFVI